LLMQFVYAPVYKYVSARRGRGPNEAAWGRERAIYSPPARAWGMDVKSRHHLRSDAIDDIETALAEQLGVDLAGDSFERVEFTDSDWRVVLVDDEPLVFYAEDADDPEPFLTVRGANAHEPEKRVVTVDTGAVSFVSDGADVMRPGIVEADAAVEGGDLVAIAEESHGKVLAIGRARVDGDDMVGEKGKVVDSIHHVGDDLYEFRG
jgi:PUA-domain protein